MALTIPAFVVTISLREFPIAGREVMKRADPSSQTGSINQRGSTCGGRSRRAPGSSLTRVHVPTFIHPAPSGAAENGT
jgi:hypothetical protein